MSGDIFVSWDKRAERFWVSNRAGQHVEVGSYDQPRHHALNQTRNCPTLWLTAEDLAER